MNLSNSDYSIRFRSFIFQMWLDLNIILTLIQPYTFFMKSDPFAHYVERIILFYTANAERLFDIPILETLKIVSISSN